jgi:glutamate-ammonia-ligase adenylyltransferase
MTAIVPAEMESLSPALKALVEVAESRLEGALQQLRGRPEWQRLWLASDYALAVTLRDPLAAIALDEAITSEDIADYSLLLSDPAASADEQTFMRWLRQQRQREMLRWVWRDVNGWCSVQQLTRELSDFADVCIELAVRRAHAELVVRHGEPIGEESGKPQRLCVIGMGKLGAQELNLSSDIDLIFAYSEAGETAGPSVISNQEFFVRLGQKVIRLLDAQTEDGFVFRVDMRLRPWGDGSALASSFASLETYYEQHGREWERYALIKARICAGDQEQGAALLKMLRPFVFRRYIDFGAFESLREMKGMIEREVRRKGMDGNVKLGRGGIREAEFIVQAFQLIRGGVDKRLQRRELLPVLSLLGEAGLLPVPVTEELKEAYLFLRQVEHRIQCLHDHQTQNLPASTQEQERLACSLGYADWSAFLQVLDQHRTIVETQFRDVVVAREASAEASPESGTRLWQANEEELPALLAGAGFRDVGEASRRLLALREGRVVRSLQQVGRERLERLMPLLITRCQAHDEPDVALGRCLPLVESVLRRSAYMMLLVENQRSIGAAGGFVCGQPMDCRRDFPFPRVLDEMLNAQTLVCAARQG